MIEIILDFAWMMGAIFCTAALLHGAYLSLTQSELVQSLRGSDTRLTDLSTQISGTEINLEASDLSC